MRRATVLAGVGGIAFSVLTGVGFVLSLAPGGSYEESNITDYLAKGHRPVVFIAFYLGLLGILGLIILLAHLRDFIGVAPDTHHAATIFWGSGLAGAASFAIGWAVIVGQVVAHVEGGNAIAIAPPLTYLIGEIGVVMIFGSGAMLLGFALIALGLASRLTLPGWLRWSTLIAGVASLAGLAFFPFFLLIIWGIVIGVWLLAAGRRSEPSAIVRQPSG
jgi:hypothetical protein